jgi:hypothetical protein
MFFDNVLVWIVVDSMSKKYRAHIHWIRFKTQRRHILEALAVYRVVFALKRPKKSAKKK